MVLRNDGREPVVIEEIVSDCACTVPDLGPGVILPGEERRFRVVFDSTDRRGFQEHLVSIRTSDGVHRIAFSARVVEAIRLFPTTLHLAIESPASVATNVVVRFARKYTVPTAGELEVQTEDPAVTVSLKPSPLGPEVYELSVRIDVAQAMGRLAYSQYVDLKDIRTGASARLNIHLKVEAPIEITPEVLNLGLVTADRIGQRTEVAISPRAGRAKIIYTAKASHPWLHTELRAAGYDVWHLSAWVSEHPVYPANQRVFVELTTDNSRLPTWRVPVVLSVLGSTEREFHPEVRGPIEVGND